MDRDEEIDARLSELIMQVLQSGSIPGKGHHIFTKLREAELAIIMYRYVVKTDEGYDYAQKDE